MENSVVTVAKEQLAAYYRVSEMELERALLQNAVLELVAVTDFQSKEPRSLEQAVVAKNPQLHTLVSQMHAQLETLKGVIQRSEAVLRIVTRLGIKLEELVTGRTLAGRAK